MSLETGSYINDLVASNPPGTDAKAQGDDHLRLIKNALKNCFAGFTGAVVVTGTDGGAVNAYTLTTTPALIGYTTRMIALFSPTIANTGDATINISGLGTRPIVSVSNVALVSGDLEVGTIYAAAYDGTSFRLLSITKNYADQLAFSAALPSQTGNAGKFITTNGTVASWTDTFTIPITFQSRVNEAKGSDIPSAATINLSTATGNLLHVTGTTTITAITIPSGAERTLVFDGILVLTNGASLILPTGANITTAAGDSCKVRGDGAATRVVSYTRADGTALTAPTVGFLKVAGPTTPAAANTLDFLTTFSANASRFSSYRVHIEGIKPSATDTLRLQFANGGSVDTGSKYYDPNLGATDTGSATSAVLSGTISSTGKGIAATIDFLNVNDATNMKVAITLSVHDNASPQFTNSYVSAVYDSANAASGFRLFWTTGSTNFAALGSVTVWGYNRT